MYSLASSQLRVSYACGSCFWLFRTFRCPGVDGVAMRSAEQHEKCRANGRPVGDGHSGRRREVTEKGDLVFLSPLVGIYAE
jgi:hypothetical protein